MVVTTLMERLWREKKVVQTTNQLLAKRRRQPSARERESHYLSGHASYRSWREFCLRGRGRRHAHRSTDQESQIPKLSWDHGYLSHSRTGPDVEEADAEADRRGDSPVLVVTDGGRGKSKAVFAMMLPAWEIFRRMVLQKPPLES